MKKTILIIVMAAVCLFLKTNGQDNKAIDVTTKGLQIGQQVPDITINNIHNYKATTAKISDFKGKLLILDFWATWCSPCVAMIPKMDSLQKQFEDKVQFLSITYQENHIVAPFLSKLNNSAKSSIIGVTEDKELHKMFPHVSLPHYVWIDKNGIVTAISDLKAVTANNISSLIYSADQTVIPKKRDMQIAYDQNIPLLINGNAGNGESMKSHSVFTGYIEGLPTGYHMTTNLATTKLTATNLSISWLYRLTYGMLINEFLGNNRIIIEVNKPATITPAAVKSMDERNKNSFCYELVLPVENRDRLAIYMKQDLDRFFDQYKVTIEKRTVPCLALERTSLIDKIASKGGKPGASFKGSGFQLQDFSLVRLITEMNMMVLDKSSRPLIDNTGYTGLIDIKIEARLNDIHSLNKALALYDLTIIEREMSIDMVIIKDKENI